MTIVFSVAKADFIVMVVDVAVVDAFVDSSKAADYTIGIKSYQIPGAGCVATWGDRGRHLKLVERINKLKAAPCTFQELDSCIEELLKKEYSFENNTDDAGYHIVGFDNLGRARLHHRFWGEPRPNPDNLTSYAYLSDHSPSDERQLQLVYNGRNDIAHPLISLLMEQIYAGKATKFDLTSHVDIVRLADFVARMVAELTPEVSPPFITHLIAPGNQIVRLQNTAYAPVDPEKIHLALRLLQSLHQDTSGIDKSIHHSTSRWSDLQSSASGMLVTEPSVFVPELNQRGATGGTVTTGTYKPAEDNRDSDLTW